MVKQLIKIGKRKCYICKEIYKLNADNFPKSNKKDYNGFRYICKKCMRQKGSWSNLRDRREKFIKDRNFTCAYCGLKNNNFAFFDIHHIKSYRHTGKHRKRFIRANENFNNLQLLCPNCHRLKTINKRYKWEVLV